MNQQVGDSSSDLQLTGAYRGHQEIVENALLTTPVVQFLASLGQTRSSTSTSLQHFSWMVLPQLILCPRLQPLSGEMRLVLSSEETLLRQLWPFQDRIASF